MNRYAGFMPNDFINGEDVCVSLWTQGCPHRCPGCHNPKTWDFEGGYPIPPNLAERIIKAISANGITRNFSILGGEPLCDENKDFVFQILSSVREVYPNIEVFLWTGYTWEELCEKKDSTINKILEMTTTLIEGRYEADKRDITLPLRGSSNQRVMRLGEA